MLADITAASRRAVTVAVLLATAALGAPVAASPPSPHPPGRSPAATGASFYDDPCEGGDGVDLRRLEVDGLFEDDRRTVRGGDVSFTAPLCSPVDDDELTGVRVDLFPRNDTAGGADFSETPSRTLVMRLEQDRGARWELREGGSVVSSGTAQIAGDPDARIAIRAAVPACEVAAASGGHCDENRRLTGVPGGPLPPLALRACSRDVDCGPAYQTVGTTTTTDPEPVRADVDYLPAPRSFQVTYPSICQQGAAAGTAATPGTRWVPLPADRPMPDRRRAAAAPNDPWWSEDGPGSPTGQWSLKRLGTTQAWDATRGSGVRVSILDSGIDGRHPDLDGRVIAVRDFVPTRDGGPGVEVSRSGDSDLNGHGSFVASQIGARADDGTGMAGLGPALTLLSARVFDAEGCASDAAIVEAIQWSVHSGAHVVNLSLGGPGESDQLLEVGRWANDRGTVLVAAAGNSGARAVDYPAGYEPYVSVGATAFADPDDPAEDPVADYSNRNDSIELVAPGGGATGPSSQNVLGACWRSAVEGRGWCREAGTSFASPLVAATAALVRAVQPDRTVEGVRELLRDAARDLTASPASPGRDDASGFGRVRAGRAVGLVAGRSDTLDSLTGSRDGTTASIAASREVVDDGGARAVVLARRDVFADALAGAALAGPRTPILLTGRNGLDDRVADEIRRVLPSGGRVWMLGGTAALADDIVQQVRDLGHSPLRLYGTTRIETANAVARQVGADEDGQVLVASAADWPDAIAGGLYAAAHEVPLVLSWPDGARPDRSPGLLATLRDLGAEDVVLLGGAEALSLRVQAEIEDVLPGTTRRVAGPDRFATAARVITDLWGRTAGERGDRYIAVNGQPGNGWALALPAAPLAASRRAPLLLISDDFALTQPERLLRERLAYRLDRPATATVIGPPSYSASDRVDRRTPQRLRELLGG